LTHAIKDVTAWNEIQAPPGLCVQSNCVFVATETWIPKSIRFANLIADVVLAA
jgi:hypothetical protein